MTYRRHWPFLLSFLPTANLHYISLLKQTLLRCGWQEELNSQLGHQSQQSLRLLSTARTWSASRTCGGAQNRYLGRFSSVLHGSTSYIRGPMRMLDATKESVCQGAAYVRSHPGLPHPHFLLSPSISQEGGESVPPLPRKISVRALLAVHPSSHHCITGLPLTTERPGYLVLQSVGCVAGGRPKLFLLH